MVQKVASCETSSESSSEIQNSATEISTDSEFAHDDPTPTREAPKKIFDGFVTKTRGSYGQPKKVQVKSSILQQPMNGRTQTKDVELKFTPLVSTPILRKSAPTSLFARNEGYALNRTQSTGGIATKVSLELKKKYLLGETNPMGCIQKSGSASTLDSKFKSFHTNISDCQKLLKPAPEISASMQMFCNKLTERTSPLSPIFGPPILFSKEKSSPLLDLNLSAEQINVKGFDQHSRRDISKCVSASSIPEIIEANVINESEGRPRSPVHEKQIIVPVIDWFKAKQKKECEFTDSLSSDSGSEANILAKPNILKNIPRLEIHDDSGAILKDSDDMAFDSLNVSINYTGRNSISEVGKSITSEKKTLNQPKTLPGMTNDSVLPDYHSALHMKQKSDDNVANNKDADKYSIKDSSGRSTPSINDDAVTAALTETELDDFEDVEYELVSEINALHSSNEQLKNKLDKNMTSDAKNIKRVDYLNSISNLGEDENKKSTVITECVNILNLNIDNIEFMDTGTETSSDDNLAIKNNGYVQFHNEEEFAEDSLSPALNIIETVNPAIETCQVLNLNIEETIKISSQNDLNTIENEKPDHSACDTKPMDSNNKLGMKQICDNEDDSILVIEAGTTTEENTCSDSTVKNITEKIADDQPQIDSTNKGTAADNIEIIPKEDKDVFETQGAIAENIYSNNTDNDKDLTEFREHCQRLQSKIEFSNVKDSLDIRKARRKSKPDITKPDLIQEEKEKAGILKQVENVIAPSKLTKREEIEKERDMNQRLVQEMVMTKMKAQNKSLERKKRTRNSFSPIRPLELSKSATTDLSNQNTDLQTLHSPAPDVLLSTIPSPLQTSQISTVIASERDISSQKVEVSQLESNPKEISTYNLPDISIKNEEMLLTPKNPVRIENEEVKRTAEKYKQNARARCRLLSDEDLGLSPEDKLIKLRQKALRKAKENENIDVHIQDSIESLVINTERRNSLFYSNDTLKRNTSFRRSKSGDASINTPNNSDLVCKLNSRHTDKIGPPTRTKSVSEISKFTHVSNIDLDNENNCSNICKSDPNLLIANKKQAKKHKDRERRKSITKIIAELFSKKKENPTNVISKGFLSRISPKSKNKSKSWFDLDLDKIEKVLEEPSLRRNSISEMNLRRDIEGNVSPPPIPPLPANYVRRHSLKDESSDPENEFRQGLGSCETLNHSEIHVASLSNYNDRKINRSVRKTARHAQLKRHRMAQEIQRKLEETEVKTRELEFRGVQVEKALRGESNGSFFDENKEESELLKEWFDLMRDRTELRRYEKELTVKAQELELEDRHARLQHELRERLENNEPKTKEEMELEGGIIKEMMDIVAKRDSLINLLEEDRLRYFEEDRDFEEEILAKGIHLTPLLKSSDNK